MDDNIVPLDRPKPASAPEVIEFLRDLLILAHEHKILLCIVGVATEEHREANGIIEAGVTLRDVERLQDIIDGWVSEVEEVEYDDYEGEE